jgi:hypothetical protein
MPRIINLIGRARKGVRRKDKDTQADTTCMLQKSKKRLNFSSLLLSISMESGVRAIADENSESKRASGKQREFRFLPSLVASEKPFDMFAVFQV